MEKVKLSKEEKRVLLEIASGNYSKSVHRKDISQKIDKSTNLGIISLSSILFSMVWLSICA